MSTKERLDVLLVNRGLFESREKSQNSHHGRPNFYGHCLCRTKAGTKVAD